MLRPAPMGEAPAVAPLVGLVETYGQCLKMSRDYAEGLHALPDDAEVDPDGLSEFVEARGQLFSAAERSLKALSASAPQTEAEAEAREDLTARAVSLLREMTRVEKDLADFLGDRLQKMHETISLMQRAQPVFRRYGHLGGDKASPNRLTCGV